MDGLNSVQLRCHRKQVGIKQLYNPMSWRVELVGVSFIAVWGSENQLQTEGWALRTPSWAAQQNEREVQLKTEELGVNMLLSVQSPTHLSHITLSQPFCNPFENKVWEVYFSKEVRSFVIIVDYVSACICICIVVSWLYNNNKLLNRQSELIFLF